MPRYDWVCDKGHVHEHVFRMADKPAEVPCTTCQAPARDRGVYGFAAKVVVGRGEKPRHEGTVKQDTGPAVVTEHGSQAHDIRNVDVMCSNAPDAFDKELGFEAVCCDQPRYWDVYDASIESVAPCPKCGAPGRVLIGAGPGNPGEFPRYDRGLGSWLQSAEHRRRVCKERGLTPVDGDYDEDKIMSAIEADVEADQKMADDYYRRIEEAPEFRDYREAREKGVYDSVLKKEPPKAFQVQTKAKPNRLRGVKV